MKARLLSIVGWTLGVLLGAAAAVLVLLLAAIVVLLLVWCVLAMGQAVAEVWPQ